MSFESNKPLPHSDH